MDLALLYCYICDCEFSANLAFFATSGPRIFLFLSAKNFEPWLWLMHSFHPFADIQQNRLCDLIVSSSRGQKCHFPYISYCQNCSKCMAYKNNCVGILHNYSCIMHQTSICAIWWVQHFLVWRCNMLFCICSSIENITYFYNVFNRYVW